jgi:hypothetical protein
MSEHISQDKALQMFEYKDGYIFWRSSSQADAHIGKKAGTECSKSGYRRVRIYGRFYQVHRIIFLMFNGYIPRFIDHINQDRSDDRIENLRAASIGQNRCNSKISANNKTGFKGVSISGRAFRAQIAVNKKKITIGRFSDPMIAAHEYNKAAIKFHGEFAVLNPVGGVFL